MRHGNVALVRLRGGKANAMNERLLEALYATLEEVDDADALVITGDGSAFSAGFALPELIELDREGMTIFMSTFESAMRRVLAFPRATVAAINGHALAGGCVLGLMCDVRLMAAGSAKIGLTEIQLGIGLPSILVEPLRIRVPPTSLGPVALEGRVFTPDEAVRISLIDEVVDAERLIARALEIASARATAPHAYAQIKRALLAPTLTACDRRREIDRETWLETWFSDQRATHPSRRRRSDRQALHVASRHERREVPGQRSRVAAARRSRRVLPARRALRLGRPDLHAHLGARAGPRASLPDQSVRDDVRRDHRVEPREDRSRGPKVLDSPYEINPAGFTIHSAIHAAREDAKCVLHTHSVNGVAVSATKRACCRSRSSRSSCSRRSAITTTRASRSTTTRSRASSRDLGDKNFLMLRNHGLLTVGRDDRRRVPAHVPVRGRVHDPAARAGGAAAS